MKRCALIAAAVFVCMLGCISTGQGKVRSLDDLSKSERQALDNSTRREVAYDHTLRQVESDHAKHRISDKMYERQSRELVQFIGDEASFQNEILVPHKHAKQRLVKDAKPDDPGSEVAATLDKAWDDWGHYLIEFPLRFAMLGLAAIPR